MLAATQEEIGNARSRVHPSNGAITRVEEAFRRRIAIPLAFSGAANQFSNTDCRMDSLPMNSSGQVECPQCKRWIFAVRCEESVQLPGIRPAPCGASVCPECEVRIMPEQCPLNRPTCRYNPNP